MPPTIAPTMPATIVAAMPMGLGPGATRRPRKPITSPTTRNPTMTESMDSGLPSVDGIKRGLDGGVATIVIDRPERRNALDRAACVALEGAVRWAVDSGCRVLVLAGEGPHFCAGADLSGVDGGGYVETL